MQHIFRFSLFWALFFITTTYSQAQTETPSVVAVGKVSAYQKDGLYGFRDETGQTIIAPTYTKVESMNKGFFRTQKDSKYGFVNAQGIEIAVPQYEESYKEFTNGLLGVQLNKKQGFIDESGKVVIPISSAAVRPFSKLIEGVAIVRKDSLWGAYNTKGETVIPFLYSKQIEAFNDLGLTKVVKSNKFGFINKAGKEVIPVIYEAIYPEFKNGLIGVQLNKKQGFLNASGKVVIPLEYDKALQFNEHNISIVNKGDIYGAFDSEGKAVIPLVYQKIYPFKNGIAPAKKDGKAGCINPKGEIVMEFKYDEFLDFNEEGIAPVKLGDKYGTINRKGAIVTPFFYDKIEDYQLIDDKVMENQWSIARCEYNGKKGCLDASGAVLVPAVYDEIGKFSEGFATVKLNDKYAYIYADGTQSTSLVFTSAKEVRNKSAEVVFNEDTREVLAYPESSSPTNSSNKLSVKSVSGYPNYNLCIPDVTKYMVINDTYKPIYIHYRSKGTSLSVGCDIIERVEPMSCGYVPFLEGRSIFYTTDGINTLDAYNLCKMYTSNGQGLILRLPKPGKE